MIEKVVSEPQSYWTKKGPRNNIVISSRIRLARNLQSLPMPLYQNETEGHIVLERVRKAAEDLNGQEGVKQAYPLHFIKLHELPSLEKQILLEKHLISPQHLEDKPNKGLLISENEAVSIMINEEDHLRIQVLFPGLQLEKAWEVADKIDNLLESKLDYAFHEEKGYLTSCLTNTGTGLRASVMIHLPALVITKQAPRIFTTLGQLGLAVRGIFGEGTEATGHIFQISNQITMGQKELEIIQNLTNVTLQLIDKEEETRAVLLKETPLQVKDRVGRALGILKYAAVLSSQEALNLLSDVRLGVDLGLVDVGMVSNELTELMIYAQPGFLQKKAGRLMEVMERDTARAALFKEKLDMRR